MSLRRLICAALLGQALLAGAATPAPAPEGPPLVSEERQGYAFEFPRVLAQQRLFGIAHGVSLLATACLDVPATANASAGAYTAWYEQQQSIIDEVREELAAFYFGARAHEAKWSHLVRALNLRPKLSLAADSPELAAACASLPEALKQPRYDLAALFKLEATLAAIGIATRADVHITACMARLPAAQNAHLKQQHAEWLTREDAAIQTAHAQLQLNWQDSATRGTAEEWLNKLREHYANPSAERCNNLAGWLQTPAASVTQSFAPAPPIVAQAAPAATETHAVSAVKPVHAPIESASLPPVVTNTPEAQTTDSNPIKSLFEFFMKAFDERPHEAQTSPHGQPGRSQRAHP